MVVPYRLLLSWTLNPFNESVNSFTAESKARLRLQTDCHWLSRNIRQHNAEIIGI